jgi:zinc transport system substrate-binding protein
MKYIASILLLVIAAGCSEPQPQPPQSKPVYFVSIPPQAGLLKILVGDNADIHTLIGEGQSPHTYEPTAQQLARLSEAKALFVIGVPFEKALLKKIEPLYPNLTIVETQADMKQRPMPHHHHGDACTHDHDAKDPHIWLSAPHAMGLAANMLNAIEKLDWYNRREYIANYEALIEGLEELHKEIDSYLAPYQGRRFYVFHPSFGYFADMYGLNQVPIEVDGKSPSPRQLADLIEQAKADNAKIIFVQKQFPKDSAQTIADAVGAKVVHVDPLAEDIDSVLVEITESLAEAFEQ